MSETDASGDPGPARGPVWAFSQYLLAGLLAFFIVVPALPSERVGQISKRSAAALRKISLVQHWSMYAPDAIQSMPYLRITAHYADGRVEQVQENLEDDEGWDTQWFWTKRRDSIWRHRLTRPKAHRERIWYLRGVCVRETRRHAGEAPVHVEMDLVKRRVRPPAKVEDGAEVLGPRRVERVAKLACGAALVNDMVQRAREEAGHGGA